MFLKNWSIFKHVLPQKKYLLHEHSISNRNWKELGWGGWGVVLPLFLYNFNRIREKFLRGEVLLKNLTDT